MIQEQVDRMTGAQGQWIAGQGYINGRCSGSAVAFQLLATLDAYDIAIGRKE